MQRPVVDPIEQPTTAAGDRAKVFTHPAYALIGASRVVGGTTLFGSDLLHESYISLRIRAAELHRGLASDRYYGKEHIVEVKLSEVQFAGLLSHMNTGDGVPCTLARVHSVEMPGLPHRQQAKVFADEVQAKAAGVVAELDALITEAEGDLSGLSGKKRESLLARLRRARTEVSSNIGFVVESMEAHMENVVEEAKMEVNAFVQTAIRRAGIESLSGSPTLRLDDASSSGLAPAALPAGHSEGTPDGEHV